MKKSPIIYAIGGGKGGIGKSLITANLAFRFSSQFKKVIAIDLDLGSANLHTCLGMGSPSTGLQEYFSGQKSLDLILFPLKGKKNSGDLALISGQRTSWNQIDSQPSKINQFMKDCRLLDADLIFFDLGAGTHPLTLDFFRLADQGIIIVLPEPTSIENSYIFLKGLFNQMILKNERFQQDEVLLKNLKKSQSPEQILNYIQKQHPQEFEETLEGIQKLKINILINQVRKKEDGTLGKSMSHIIKSYFYFESQLMGSVAYDENVWKAVRRKEIFMNLYPQSLVSRDIEQITRNTTISN